MLVSTTERADAIRNPGNDEGKAKRRETQQRMERSEEHHQEEERRWKMGGPENKEVRKKMRGDRGGAARSWETAAEKGESAKASHVPRGTWLLQDFRRETQQWMERSEERQQEEECRLKTGGPENKEAWKKTSSDRGGAASSRETATEKRESVNASHVPGGMWLLQVWNRSCGPFVKLVGKAGREREGGLGTPEQCT
ncbi:hypothetical protein NDU88_004865 [Pleurodeles waltl]|uniref:Uncharacterized protein n=1 Tax=Pleurodeles waltl TaxID=8319 RepID=A0AAV7NPR2_PLEWA|nr:hypothetical protein NDU88_004865 [Pleurodeles waltl]